MNLEKFIQKQIPGLNVLRMATERYGPGTLIDSGSNDIKVGHLKDIFTHWPVDKWNIDRMTANLIHGTGLTGSFTAGATANILGIVKAGVGIQTGTTVDYEITEIIASEMLNTSRIEIDNAFDSLKNSDRAKWRKFKSYTYILECYFAKAMTITFKRNGNAMAEADIKAKFDIEASANITWQSGGTIKIAANDKVPFGVRGFKVRA